jgi:hypothetical protein
VSKTTTQLKSAAALAFALAVPQLAAAQTTTTQPAARSNELRMPYQRDFWGYAGATIGRSSLESCPGIACDRRDTAYRLFGGGRFNDIVGLEAGYLNLGRFQGGGGAIESHGIDLALTAGIPIMTNSSLFAKLGGAYMRSEVTAPGGGIAGGKDSGWGPRFGLGAQVGLGGNWALRADWDRYKIDLPGSDRRVDTFTVGAQYRF